MKFGLSIEYTRVFIYESEILLGHLFNFKNLNGLKSKALIDIGEQNLQDLEDKDSDTVTGLDYKEKKERNHILITLGALFEVAEIEEVKLSLVIGYLLELHSETEDYRNRCFQNGNLYFLKKGGDKNVQKIKKYFQESEL